MIEVKNITKKYGNQLALNNVSFSIKKGEVVGFLGPNGAGKSTMMKIINSFISSDKGVVNVGGVDVFENSVEAKSKIGYLPENNPLYGEMYVREYLEYVANIYKVPYNEIENVIFKTGLQKEANKQISQLSKGYKQRVGLAAAIIHNPDYLILDEPTTGLDPNQIVEIRNLIKEFGKEKTVLLSTHIMQEVEAMCDRVIIINNGSLVVDESLSDFGSKESDVCKVVFDKEIESDIFQAELNVNVLNKDSKLIYKFKFNDEDILKNLLEFAIKNNVNIIEFKISKKSLEDTFRDVTS
ncbi:MAG: ATP-binding cassette domain-containing protein [Flavobacteriales bacterium]|nr:ATP-binding cassette domain-containing protein [Flavobacteriales bacterium]